MNKHVDKYIEKLTDKVLKDASLEAPSEDFTAHVMSKVEAIAQSPEVVYKPLISKPLWFVIIAGVIGLVTYSIFNSPTEEGLLSTVDLSFLTNNKVSIAVTSVTFSKTILYSVVLFALMFGIQIPILRGYFDKRLNY